MYALQVHLEHIYKLTFNGVKRPGVEKEVSNHRNYLLNNIFEYFIRVK